MKYIIGDVHGCYKTLKALIKKLPNDADIVFVGDLVDRGADSRKVIKLIRKNNYKVVLGNHEQLMIEGVEEINKGARVNSTIWANNGYQPTIQSYDRDFENKALLDDIEWLKGLPLYLEFDEEDSLGRKLIVSHAPCLEHFNTIKDFDDEGEEFLKDYLDDINEEIFLWNRRIPKDDQDKYFNIFGHNIVKKWIYNKSNSLKVDKKVLMTDGTLLDVKKGFAAIDTGCFSGDCLSCIEFPTMRVIQQKNIEDS